MTTILTEPDPICTLCDLRFRSPQRGAKPDHPEWCKPCRRRVYEASYLPVPKLIAKEASALLAQRIVQAAYQIDLRKPLQNP